MVNEEGNINVLEQVVIENTYITEPQGYGEVFPRENPLSNVLIDMII